MYSNNRDAYRQAFFTAWQKYQKKLLLEPIEAQLIEVILMHTEYHSLFDQQTIYQKQEFQLEENPFFHMSLHVSVQEQIKMNRPFGVTLVYQKLLTLHPDEHEVQHRMMECLADILWQAQQDNTMPNEMRYLEKLNQIIKIL